MSDNPHANGNAPAGGEESPVARALTELSTRLASDTGDFDEFEGPVYWPTRDAGQAEFDWSSLMAWVARLRQRFPHMTARVPDCWYRHNDLVEALLALRDHERVSYAATAPASGGVEWHRAFRDLEARWDSWIKRFTCTIPGKGHPPLDPDQPVPKDFAEFVAGDLAQRRASEESPTSQGEPAA